MKMVQCSKCKKQYVIGAVQKIPLQMLGKNLMMENTAYYVDVVNKEKMNKPKPMTNEEWFCSLPTEEKAKWLQEHMDYCSNCDCNKDLCYKGYDCYELAFLEWLTFLEWLKQPHTAK